MKHSNEAAVDHSKNDIYKALTGKNVNLKQFAEPQLFGLKEHVDLSNEKHSKTTSYMLMLIINHPTLTDEEKVILTYELGRFTGYQEGEQGVCANCAIGPASRLMHKYFGHSED